MASAVGGAGGTEIEQVGRGGGGADDAERRRRMPALVVMMEVHRAAETDLGLDADDIRQHELFAAAAAIFRKCDKHRNERDRLMATKHAAEIVIIERVRRGAVD